MWKGTKGGEGSATRSPEQRTDTRRATYRLEQLDEIVLLDKLAHLGNDDFLLRSLRVRTLLLPGRIRDGDEKSVSRLEFTTVELESGGSRRLSKEKQSKPLQGQREGGRRKKWTHGRQELNVNETSRSLELLSRPTSLEDGSVLEEIKTNG